MGTTLSRVIWPQDAHLDAVRAEAKARARTAAPTRAAVLYTASGIVGEQELASFMKENGELFDSSETCALESVVPGSGQPPYGFVHLKLTGAMYAVIARPFQPQDDAADTALVTPEKASKQEVGRQSDLQCDLIGRVIWPDNPALASACAQATFLASRYAEGTVVLYSAAGIGETVELGFLKREPEYAEAIADRTRHAVQRLPASRLMADDFAVHLKLTDEKWAVTVRTISLTSLMVDNMPWTAWHEVYL